MIGLLAMSALCFFTGLTHLAEAGHPRTVDPHTTLRWAAKVELSFAAGCAVAAVIVEALR